MRSAALNRAGNPGLGSSAQALHELHLRLEARNVVQRLAEQGEAAQPVRARHERPEHLHPRPHHPPRRHRATTASAPRRPLPAGAQHDPARPSHYPPAPRLLPATPRRRRHLVAGAAHDAAQERLVAPLRSVLGQEAARPCRRARGRRRRQRHGHVGGEAYGVAALAEAYGLGRLPCRAQAQQELRHERLLEPCRGRAVHCCGETEAMP
jgi:hypothetical protein